MEASTNFSAAVSPTERQAFIIKSFTDNYADLIALDAGA
jgi:hypothetical protein